MEFTVNSARLVKDLALLAGIVPKSATIPVLANVLIEALDAAVELTSTDLETALKVRCPAAVKKSGASTLPARRLLDWVRLLPDGDLHVKVSEDTHWGSLASGSAKCRMAGIPRGSFPDLPAWPSAQIEIPLGVLASMIARTSFAISDEESRFTLQAALLLISGEQALMVATDGHRLASDQAAVASAPDAIRVLLPRRAAQQLMKLAALEDPNTPVGFARATNHLFFMVGHIDGRRLMARELTGTFPDYARVLPKDQPHSVRLNRQDLLSAIGRVREFADGATNAIRMRFAGGELILMAQMEAGDSEESVAVDYSGPDIEIGFNAAYLVEFLRAVADEHVSFLFKDGAGAGELRPESSGDSYRYVVMPMRV